MQLQRFISVPWDREPKRKERFLSPGLTQIRGCGTDRLAVDPTGRGRATRRQHRLHRPPLLCLRQRRRHVRVPFRPAGHVAGPFGTRGQALRAVGSLMQ
eukprot:2471013-Rhodomonas_salina.2